MIEEDEKNENKENNEEDEKSENKEINEEKEDEEVMTEYRLKDVIGAQFLKGHKSVGFLKN